MAKKFKLILLIIATVSFIAYAEESSVLKWSKINEFYFEFYLPSTFKKIEVHGEDS